MENWWSGAPQESKEAHPNTSRTLKERARPLTTTMESAHMSNNHFEGNIAGERMSLLNWISENDTAAPSPLLSRKGELQRRKAAAALELQRC